jgi:tRNA uridine 5-carbamoylmethylation protein Kti12
MTEHIYVKGPPRSGKSTIARGLAAEFKRLGLVACIVEPDHQPDSDAYVVIWDGWEPRLDAAPEYRTITTESLLSRAEREAHRRSVPAVYRHYL